MKTTLKLMLLALLVAIGSSLFSLSDGAFNMTGAPGEGDCSACHTGVPINGDTDGSIQLTVNNSNGEYEPGKEYEVNVRVSHPSRGRFGFALTTRSVNPFQRMGDFIVDAESGVFNRLDFVAHKRASIDSNQQKNWSFKWKAPDTATMDIIFYVAGVAANGNNDNTGDLVYTKQLKLRKAGTTGGVTLLNQSSSFSVYPNPAGSFIMLRPSVGLNQIEELFVSDIHGKLMETIRTAQLPRENGAYRIQVSPEYSPGVYFITVIADGTRFVHKFYVSR